MLKRIFALILLLGVAFSAVAERERTREDVRSAYEFFISAPEETPFERAPALSGKVSAGELTPAAEASALGYVNFFRYLAYISSDVRVDELYALRAAHAATLLAINGVLEHDPPKPDCVSDDFYLTARAGAQASNIASMNWFSPGILDLAIEYFARDDGEINLAHLGHRRWLLNPRMAKTGFGLAVSDSGISYAAMYAQDMSREVSEWHSVKWPSEGAFPADLMSYELAWSVILDPGVFSDDFSEVGVTLAEKTLGDVPLISARVDTAAYGAGACVIFLPDFSNIEEPGYWQNQVWTVKITGLKLRNGAETEMNYSVDMISLFPIDPANVELSETDIIMTAGDTRALAAAVVPAWADDLGVTWSCDDESVCVVNSNGALTAISPGECVITAASVNGRQDVCRVTVVQQ